MITLMLNGGPLPPVLTVNVAVELDIQMDGAHPASAEWSIWTPEPLANGTGPAIAFTPVLPVTTYINIRAHGLDGSIQTQGFTVQVLAYSSAPILLGVNWSKLRYLPGETLLAELVYAHPRGLSYKSISWRLYHNSLFKAAGTSKSVRYEGVVSGVYRIVAQAVDYDGNAITGDSSVVVPGGFEVQATLRPEPGRTMQFIGYARTDEQIGDAVFSSSVGMVISALGEEVYLLPGTTFFQIELDPDADSAPPQVVTRTPTGNWSLRGQPSGSIDLPYEFLDNSLFIPAPADLRLKIVNETFSTSVGSVEAFNFRVRIKCFYDGQQVYEYRACDRSMSAGGGGMRARRFVAFFSDVDMLIDADSTEKRLGGSGPTELQRFSTYLPTFIPLPFSLDGAPDTSDLAVAMFYTNQNWIATYDPRSYGVKEVDVRATYGIEQCRPFTMSFMMPAFSTVIQRPRRLSGTVAVYMANGYINNGAVVSVRVSTAGGYRSESVIVPVTSDGYSPDLWSYVKIGEAAVDISDEEFIDNGIVGMISVDESAVDRVAWPISSVRPDPVPLESAVYSTTSARHARLDGACYYNAGPVAVMMGTTTSTGTGTYTVDATGTAYVLTPDIVECYDPKCMPVGIYCYGEYNGSETIQVPQPLYRPAPNVAPADQVTRCFCNPCLIEAWVGTNGTLPSYPDFVSYQDGSYCGVPWEYVSCDGSNVMVVPYPVDTVPPDYVAYSESCWSNGGVLAYTTGHTLVSRDAVYPVYDCQDVICTGSDPNGTVARYYDYETGRKVDVGFNNVTLGLPVYGVIPQTYDTGLHGLSAGQLNILFREDDHEKRFLTIAGSGVLSFTVRPSSIYKSLIRYRGAVRTGYVLGVGLTDVITSVEPGDQFALRMGHSVVASVAWVPWIDRPRLYATGTVSDAWSPSVVRAVGFTGLTDRSEYAFYGTLPGDVTASEVNPSSILTVASQGTEYTLLRVRGITDTEGVLPLRAQWYNNQPLAGPWVFNLYAEREQAGQNGEMDVWMEESGELPAALSVSPYKAVIKIGQPPFRSTPPDVDRNSLRVIPNSAGVINTHRWPSAYIADSGDRIVAAAPSSTDRPVTGTFNGTMYAWAGTCPGIAYSIVSL